MHEIIAKIARFAVSKFAAFCYAVAVGVAGNLIFHFVQPRDPAPSVAPAVATAPHEAPPAAGAAATAPVSLPPASAPTAPQADTAPASARAALPAAPVRPAASKPAAASAALPEPPAIVALPSPAAMPTPALKPTALPGSPPATVPREAPAAPAAPAALPPIGPAIEVAVPPMPPAASHVLPAPVAALPLPAAPAATSKEAPNGLELSDVWHPYRAVKKGLHWAGGQVPLVGDDGDAAPHPGPAAPSAPISLLPTAKPTTSENAEASIPPSKPAAPGPGSGGLY